MITIIRKVELVNAIRVNKTIDENEITNAVNSHRVLLAEFDKVGYKEQMVTEFMQKVVPEVTVTELNEMIAFIESKYKKEL